MPFQQNAEDICYSIAAQFIYFFPHVMYFLLYFIFLPRYFFEKFRSFGGKFSVNHGDFSQFVCSNVKIRAMLQTCTLFLLNLLKLFAKQCLKSNEALCCLKNELHLHHHHS